MRNAIHGGAKMSDIKAPSGWPKPLTEEAFHGVAGALVKEIAPHTESDPVALLVQLLVAFGNSVGRGPHFMVEATRHYTNLFCVMVGMSSKGRKGTSWNHVLDLMTEADSEWVERRVPSGLSSGEGLIHAVRDTQTKRTEDGQEPVIIPGEDDKRLLVVEEEFASVLKNFQREGNTLSPVLRKAWDGKALQSLTKKQDGSCLKPHVSVVGHITQVELLRYFTATEMANGLGNRFAWFSIRRQRLLPFGGSLDSEALNLQRRKLVDAHKFARDVGVMTLSAGSKEVWAKIYAAMAEEKPGILGAITGRAEPIILRLAMIYALLDRTEIIEIAHLYAAIALWEYAEESCRYIFGDSTGDKYSDQILEVLKTKQRLSQTEISGLFGNNRNSQQIQESLRILSNLGLIKSFAEKAEHSKKPITYWCITNTKYEFDEVDPSKGVSSEESYKIREFSDSSRSTEMSI
jgi:hypothetical protein